MVLSTSALITNNIINGNFAWYWFNLKQFTFNNAYFNCKKLDLILNFNGILSSKVL